MGLNRIASETSKRQSFVIYSLDVTPCKFSNNELNYILHHKVALWLSLTGSTSTLRVPKLYVYVNPCQQQPSTNMT